MAARWTLMHHYEKGESTENILFSSDDEELFLTKLPIHEPYHETKKLNPKDRSFSEKMAALWAANEKQRKGTQTVTAHKPKEFHGKTPLADGEIRNDDASRLQIESILRKQGISHQATLDNLVFDYLNTPVGIRDTLIQENIHPVQEQIKVQQEQMQAQQQTGYVVPSFDVVEKSTLFGEKMTAAVATCDGSIDHSSYSAMNYRQEHAKFNRVQEKDHGWKDLNVMLPPSPTPEDTLSSGQ
ncbi:unnamed protein product [Rotaria socialis]|uniref:Uncharacterized protein n=1 Tax=Rotaria socialis TaxID=392032 RepID=A0A820KKW1_9BILA|nr:unnamed protein product [Rotaria socialis]CAF4341734.1 unnamed protein product [Rotaria socialis]CAF4583491.1 unnamed protein product [Rotaria socialis]